MPRSDADERRLRFESLALPFMRALYNTALRLTQEPQDAADLMQETFLRAYRTFENFTPGTNCKAWLFTILYSIFVNQYRQAKQRPRVESLEELEERFHQFAQAPDPAPDITTVEGWGWRWSPEVERALRQLPEDFRAPLLLVDVEELAYEEAASVLGCAVGKRAAAPGRRPRARRRPWPTATAAGWSGSRPAEFARRPRQGRR